MRGRSSIFPSDDRLCPDGRKYRPNVRNGPEVVKEVLSQEVTFEDLGGARTHATKSGVAHFVAKDEVDCMDKIKTLLSYLPQNNKEEPEILAADVDDPNRLDTNLINVLPDNPYQSYDMKEI